MAADLSRADGPPNSRNGGPKGAPAWALEELRTARVAHLATADAEGRPLVVPICFVLSSSALYSAIDGKPKQTRRLRRVRNIESNPEVALVVDRYDEDWRRLWYVLIRGRAHVVLDSEARRRARRLLTDKYPQYLELPIAEDAAVLRISMDRVTAWRFDAGS